ncbi:hypothetical protein [Methylobacterium sp. E-025]|uniref:hypothetical protein n=1 Tax=Methylobacterium sp. E-025 TaxID=2836561 RepID=UPI00391B85DE
MPKALQLPRLPENGYQPAFAPRGLSRMESARHVGVSPSLFDEMVRDGRMPQPKQINARVLWDRVKLEVFFEALPERQSANAEADGDTFADWQ